MIKKIYFAIIIGILILSGCQTIPKKYTNFKGIPCYFNGGFVGAINRNATLGSLVNRCKPSHKGYRTKRGQSVNVKRGTPVYAIANMTLVNAVNRSAHQRCKPRDAAAHLYTGGCKKPFDDLELMFKDELGNYIMFYHLIPENPFVPGFNKGLCKNPIDFGFDRWKRSPANCGGIVKQKVKKGEIIGWSGTTGGGTGDHFSFAINIVNHPDFPDQKGWIIPSNSLTWENLPSNDNTIYLLPLKHHSISGKDKFKF